METYSYVLFMFSRFIHVIVYGMVSIIWISHNFFICSPVDGHLNFFPQYMPVFDSATVHILYIFGAHQCTFLRGIPLRNEIASS